MTVLFSGSLQPIQLSWDSKRHGTPQFKTAEEMWFFRYEISCLSLHQSEGLVSKVCSKVLQRIWNTHSGKVFFGTWNWSCMFQKDWKAFAEFPHNKRKFSFRKRKTSAREIEKEDIDRNLCRNSFKQTLRKPAVNGQE